MDVLDLIVALSRQQRTAKIVYKKVAEPEPTIRTVEPYTLQEHNDNLMVRAWQLVPELASCDNCWRTFRIDRIVSVVDGGEEFDPRRPVTIAEGEIYKWAIQRRSETLNPVNLAPAVYLQFVETSLLDGRLTKDEVDGAYLRAKAITPEQKRAVHAKVYAAVLQEVALDGEVTDDEDDYLQQVRDFLRTLGWAP